MAISRAQALKELLPGLNALFGLEYKKYENEHAEIYETESSERSFEEEVKLSGFGNFEIKDKSQRPGRNPKTGASMKIKASKSVRFVASSALKASL